MAPRPRQKRSGRDGVPPSWGTREAPAAGRQGIAGGGKLLLEAGSGGSGRAWPGGAPSRPHPGGGGKKSPPGARPGSAGAGAGTGTGTGAGAGPTAGAGVGPVTTRRRQG